MKLITLNDVAHILVEEEKLPRPTFCDSCVACGNPQGRLIRRLQLVGLDFRTDKSPMKVKYIWKVSCKDSGEYYRYQKRICTYN